MAEKTSLDAGSTAGVDRTLDLSTFVLEGLERFEQHFSGSAVAGPVVVLRPLDGSGLLERLPFLG
ncbi:MAG: hypothetical protein AAGF23_21940 [Acidobacteriota bacterium]